MRWARAAGDPVVQGTLSRFASPMHIPGREQKPRAFHCPIEWVSPQCRNQVSELTVTVLMDGP